MTRQKHDLQCSWGDSCFEYVLEYTHGVFEQVLQDNSNTFAEATPNPTTLATDSHTSYC